MKRRFQQFFPLLSTKGIGGCVQYLAMGTHTAIGELSRYRLTSVALGEVASPVEVVRKAAICALRRLPCRIQTVSVAGKSARILATLDQMDLFIRMRRISPGYTRVVVDASRPTSMGKAAADTVLEQTCRLAREMIGSNKRHGQPEGPARPFTDVQGHLNLAGTGKGEAA